MHTIPALAAAAWLAAAPPQDTTVTVRGILQVEPDSTGRAARAVVVLPEPLSLGGQPVNMLVLSGGAGRWRRYDGRYVEASGVVSPSQAGGMSFLPARVREVEPEGGSGKTVTLSFSQRALVSLAVLPRRFAWQTAGRSSGATPVALYRIANHGESELEFEFPSNEFVCVAVRAEGDPEPRWRFQWRYPRADTRLAVRVGTVFWAMVPLPREALPAPGRYTVRASLCGTREYEVETAVEVTR